MVLAAEKSPELPSRALLLLVLVGNDDALARNEAAAESLVLVLRALETKEAALVESRSADRPHFAAATVPPEIMLAS